MRHTLQLLGRNEDGRMQWYPGTVTKHFEFGTGLATVTLDAMGTIAGTFGPAFFVCGDSGCSYAYKWLQTYTPSTPGMLAPLDQGNRMLRSHSPPNQDLALWERPLGVEYLITPPSPSGEAGCPSGRGSSAEFANKASNEILLALQRCHSRPPLTKLQCLELPPPTPQPAVSCAEGHEVT